MRHSRNGQARSNAEARAAIRRARGLFKHPPGSKPFAEEWADHKSEERALEEKKIARFGRTQRPS